MFVKIFTCLTGPVGLGFEIGKLKISTRPTSCTRIVLPGFPRFLPHVSETYPIIEYSVSGVQCRRCDVFDKDFSVFDGRPGQLAGSRAEQSFKCHGGNDLRATSMAIQRFSSTSHDAQ